MNQIKRMDIAIKHFKYILLILVFFSCAKNEDDPNDSTESEEVNVWIFNDSIEFNSYIDYLLADSINNTLYCNGHTYIEFNSSIVRITGDDWFQLGHTIGDPFSGMELYKNRLYVAGSGLYYENNSNHQLLYWDGNSWNVGIEPLTDWGRSLEVHQGELFFGCSGFRKLNDTTWSTLSDGIHDTPWELYSYEDELFGVLRNYTYSVAKWDFTGNNWIKISEETPNLINTILGVNNEIFIGSRFSLNNEGNLINGFAKFDGTDWQDITYNLTPDSLGVQMGEVNGLEYYKEKIYAALTFLYKALNDQGEIEVRTKHVVVRLENNSWEQVGFDFNFPVECLEVFNNELYIGGDFSWSLAKLKTE